MKRILTALVLIPLVLLLVFLGNAWMITAATALVAMLATWEFLGLTSALGANPPRAAVLIAIALLFVGAQLWPDQVPAILSLLSVALLLFCTFWSPVERVLADALSSIFSLFYTGFTLTAVPWLHARENGPSLVVFVLFAVWAGDSVALYVGRTLGRHKLAPRISPNKTWEGTAGSIAGSLLITALLLWLASLFGRHNLTYLSFSGPQWRWFALAVLVNIAGQVGDLAESALKRSAGVKDSGTLLPGHGGILDRIDALLLAAPVLWYALVLQLQF